MAHGRVRRHGFRGDAWRSYDEPNRRQPQDGDQQRHAGRERRLRHQQHRAAAEQRSAQQHARLHPTVHLAPLVLFDRGHAQAVDGHVLRSGRHGMGDQHGQQPGELLARVEPGHRHQQQPHRHLGHDDPAAIADPRRGQVHQRRPQPLQGPGQDRRRNDRRDPLAGYAERSPVCRQGPPNKADRRPFAEVKRREKPFATSGNIHPYPRLVTLAHGGRLIVWRPGGCYSLRHKRKPSSHRQRCPHS